MAAAHAKTPRSSTEAGARSRCGCRRLAQARQEAAQARQERQLAKAARLEAALSKQQKQVERLPANAQQQLKRGAGMHAFGRWHLLCDGIPELRALQEQARRVLRVSPLWDP